MKVRVGLLLPFVIFTATAIHSDDGAASIAAGGIVVMKRETRVVMAKEVLNISTTKVIVDYDFRNDSDEDITTEVAFPIPEYEFSLDRASTEQGFADFQLLVNGSMMHYEVETRAFVKDREYTKLLNDVHVDVGTYGHGLLLDKNGKPMAKSQDIERLTPAQRHQLASVGLIDPEDNEPLWRTKEVLLEADISGTQDGTH